MDASLDEELARAIVAGGDTRLLPARNGLNRYGCSPLPRDAIAFGSCTCSSPSPRGMRRARQVFDRLRRAADRSAEAARLFHQQRRELKRLLQLPPDVDVALVPSGTDAELLALALAAAGHDRPIANVVVAAREVGSGSPLAAAAKHYDELLPSGRRTIVGSPVNEDLADRVRVEFVDVRDARGKALSTAEVDAAATEGVARALAGGAHVLLHVVSHSKTGLHAPTWSCVERIRRHVDDDVTVVVDAAQARTPPDVLRRFLQAGAAVIFTGSKFYGGPPFSGALLVPPRLSAKARDPATWPTGFEDYFDDAALPDDWSAVAERGPDSSNEGLLLRWAAALVQIEAHERVPAGVRRSIVRAFDSAVAEILGDSPAIDLLPETTGCLDDAGQTVFSFRVVSPDGGCRDRIPLEELHRRLNEPGDVEDDVGAVSRSWTTSSHAAAAPAVRFRRKRTTLFHLGQPVGFANGEAVLRVALGAETIVRLATDDSLGETLEARIDWLHEQLRQLRTKLETLAFADEPAGVGAPRLVEPPGWSI